MSAEPFPADSGRAATIPIAGAVAGVLITLVCQGAAQSGSERETPAFGFPAWREKCSMEPLGLSPEAWTRREDAERIVNGRYVEPVPIRCVLGSYRMPALKRAATAGDPVARLAVAYDDLSTAERPCDHLATLEHDLVAAYRPLRSSYQMPPTLDGAAPLARVPEAALLLGQVFAACGRPDDAKKMWALAGTLGLDVRTAQAEIETPLGG